MLEVQRVNPPHDRQLGRRHRPRLVIHAAAAQPQQLRLPHQRQRVPAVDHRFALSSPALPSAPDKKSFSSVSSPILACNVFTSSAGAVAPPEAPNTSAAPPTSCAFQAVIWFGCISNCCAKSASVFSPLRAANATFALTAGLWVRRIRFVMLAPDPRHHRRFQADPPLIALSEFGQPPLLSVASLYDRARRSGPFLAASPVRRGQALLRHWRGPPCCGAGWPARPLLTEAGSKQRGRGSVAAADHRPRPAPGGTGAGLASMISH